MYIEENIDLSIIMQSKNKCRNILRTLCILFSTVKMLYDLFLENACLHCSISVHCVLSLLCTFRCIHLVDGCVDPYQ